MLLLLLSSSSLEIIVYTILHYLATWELLTYKLQIFQTTSIYIINILYQSTSNTECPLLLSSAAMTWIIITEYVQFTQRKTYPNCNTNIIKLTETVYSVIHRNKCQVLARNTFSLKCCQTIKTGIDYAVVSCTCSSR